MGRKEWQEYALTLKKVLDLELSPVAVCCHKASLVKNTKDKVRICRAILDAAGGEVIHLDKATNACFGASWHLGFSQIKDQKTINMIKKFVVEGEKLFCSYETLDKLLSQMPEPPDNSACYFLISAMEKLECRPQLVIFVVNAEAACRLLTLVTFLDGNMPKIQIGGPTCRMSVIYPLITGEVNLSFYDYTARKMCNLEKDKLLISIPYDKIPKIIDALKKCSAGEAKIEFPQEFREFLQKRLTAKQPT